MSCTIGRNPTRSFRARPAHRCAPRPSAASKSVQPTTPRTTCAFARCRAETWSPPRSARPAPRSSPRSGSSQDAAPDLDIESHDRSARARASANHSRRERGSTDGDAHRSASVRHRYGALRHRADAPPSDRPRARPGTLLDSAATLRSTSCGRCPAQHQLATAGWPKARNAAPRSARPCRAPHRRARSVQPLPGSQAAHRDNCIWRHSRRRSREYPN